MIIKLLNMSSVRNWGSERFENRLRTQKPSSYRQKSQIINWQPQKKQDSDTLRIFSKQASSYYEDEDNLNESLIKIETNQQSDDEQKSLHTQKSFPSKTTNKTQQNIQEQTKQPINLKNNDKSKKQHELKNLDDIQVGYKNIEEYHDEKQRQEQARQFVLRVQREKRQFQGRIYLIKREQQQRKKRAYFQELASKMEQKQISKIKRIKEAQKRLEQFKNKSIERQETVRRQRAFSVDKKLSKIKFKLDKYKEEEKIRVQSPTYRLGKKYLQQSGRIRKRVKTESTQYFDLTEQEREELDRIRQKIDLLTKSMKK